jgi:hypothetical protein
VRLGLRGTRLRGWRGLREFFLLRRFDIGTPEWEAEVRVRIGCVGEYIPKLYFNIGGQVGSSSPYAGIQGGLGTEIPRPAGENAGSSG